MIDEIAISAAIMDGFHAKLRDHLSSDVAVVGAGPSGLVAARELAGRGNKVIVVEKRLTPGGGVWGGAMAMNEVVVQADALPLLEVFGVRHEHVGQGLYRSDAIELASGLVLGAVQSGVVVLNMTTVEDLCVTGNRVTGVVINRTGAPAGLPIDPLTLRARTVLDATGHEAAAIDMLRRRGLCEPDHAVGEGPMNAAEGERFVVERAGQVHPGLWVCGMAVCTVFGGPRMGPIFGGMLRSGQRCAQLIDQTLGHAVEATSTSYAGDHP